MIKLNDTMKTITSYCFYLSIIFCFFLNTKCTFSQNNKNMEDTLIRKVVIKHTSFDILTPISVSCDQYEDYFSSNIKIVEINNEEKFQQLLFLLLNMEHIDKNFAETVDTRAVLEMFKDDDSIEVVCLGNLSIKMDGVLYKNNSKIRNFINQLFR
jgi:hypothetical protein